MVHQCNSCFLRIVVAVAGRFAMVGNMTGRFLDTGNDCNYSPVAEGSVVGCTCNMYHKVVGTAGMDVVVVVGVFPMLLRRLLFVVDTGVYLVLVELPRHFVEHLHCYNFRSFDSCVVWNK